jgi:hypothetical protein
MIKRTSREHVLKILEDNQNNWKILDIGCNRDAVNMLKQLQIFKIFLNFIKTKIKILY